MRRLLFTIGLSAALVSGSLVGPAHAAGTSHGPAKPRLAAPDARASQAAERLERGAGRGQGRTVLVACENGCARPTYTRE